MKIETERLIAVFDLDGVLVENPPEAMVGGPPITDRNFWDKHWMHPESSKLQQEMVDMANSLVGANWQLIVLTARPESYRPWTIQLLRRMGIFVSEKPKARLHSGYGRPVLEMLPLIGIPQSSAEWKQQTVREWLSQGAKIQFMVEDYMANCEAIRALVPVLLYERKKVSRHLKFFCDGCAGLTACWCPVAK